jgi:hypothetical protein
VRQRTANEIASFLNGVAVKSIASEKAQETLGALVAFGNICAHSVITSISAVPYFRSGIFSRLVAEAVTLQQQITRTVVPQFILRTVCQVPIDSSANEFAVSWVCIVASWLLGWARNAVIIHAMATSSAC